jgi:hypothetical protein
LAEDCATVARSTLYRVQDVKDAHDSALHGIITIYIYYFFPLVKTKKEEKEKEAARY